MQSIYWDEEYLKNNIPFHEYDWLECKGRKELDISLPGVSDINRAGLGKVISALANSGGGYIVLGINDKTKDIDEGGININLKQGTKEWLEDILPSLVDPRLIKFNVYEITSKCENSKIHKDKAIYVIEIVDSGLAPHQSAIDHVYYIRSGSRSTPASNRIVMDILGRQKYPNILPSFSYAYNNSSDPNKYLRSGENKLLITKLTNEGNVLAEYVNVILFIPKYLLAKGYADSQRFPLIEIESIMYYRCIRENVISEIYNARGEFIGREPGSRSPILPKRYHTFSIPIVSKGDFDLDRSYSLNSEIIWEIYADNMPFNNGTFAMSSIRIEPNLHWN